MKNVRNINGNSIFRSIMKSAASVVLFVLLTSSNIYAADANPELPVAVTYVGTENYSPVFLIQFDNEEEEAVLLTLKDEAGNIIYTEVVKDKKFSKRFKLEGAELGKMKLVLTLRYKGASNTEVFEISRNARQVEEVSVAKI